MNLLIYVIPLFLALILLELRLEKKRGTDYYRFNDAITSLTTASMSQLYGVFRWLVPFSIYIVVYEEFAFFELPNTAFSWILAFFAYEFFYYWLHRNEHRINLLWASHVVHHSSEEFNLTTALRRTISSVFGIVFFLPLALIGMEPFVYAMLTYINLVYQYWVHTRHIGKLGWYEKYFTTPSNHRVHHAQNDVYIDRNYGGVLIIWDRMFGSYQEELDDEPCIFGSRDSLHSWNPVWANVHIYHQLFKDCWHTKNWLDKLTLWFHRPGWRPSDVIESHPIEKVDLNKFQKFDTQISTNNKIYAWVQFVISVAITFIFIFNLSSFSLLEKVAVVVFVTISSFSIGAILEGRTYAWMFELAKNFLFIMVLLVLMPVGHFTVGAILIGVMSIAFVLFSLLPKANKAISS